MSCSASRIEQIFKIFESLNPIPAPELNFTNLYTLLVAVVLSAQASDKSVNKVTHTLFQEADSAEKMITLGLEGLRQRIKSLGLYRTKAQNVLGLSKILQEQYHGHVPSTRTELEALPGVGRKTANVVLNIGFGYPTLPVDTHIFRVSHRLGLSTEKTPLGVEKDLESLIPSPYKKKAHAWLILQGRYICKARKPLCPTCPLNNLCPYDRKENDLPS